MAVMQVKVSLKNREPVVVPITPWVLIEAEEHFGSTMVTMFSDMSARRLTWLAWKAMLVDGQEVKTFEPFAKDLAELPELVSQEDEAPLSAA